MLLAVLLGFILACLVPVLFKMSKKYAGMIISILPLGLFAYYSSFLPFVASGGTVIERMDWIPFLGVNLTFILDGLSLTFAMIISGIGFAVFLYASYYLKHSEKIIPFYIYILIFMASMLGVVTSDNALALFVFWELTSISSFLLIGFNHEQEKSRFAALQALLVTAAGGLALLAGLILLWQVVPTFSISEMFAHKELIISSDYYTAIFILFAAGAFTKSAQFPFHFWLPNAMEAPTPVSAYLHSATMVKAGVFLLAKFSLILGGTELWQWTLALVGGWTMLFSSFLALKQTDLKKLLAYSTVSVLGTLTMLIGIGGEYAIPAMIVYLIAHALYKGALFLTAGIIDHETGTRDITKLGGLKKYLPITATIGTLAALSGMGIIPFLGFVGKEMLYDSVQNFGSASVFFTIATVMAAVNIFAVMGFSGILPFYGAEKYPNEKPHDAPWQMWLGPISLAALGLIFGISVGLTIEPIAEQATAAMLSNAPSMHLSLWHGFNLTLALSALTIALGSLLLFNRIKIANLFENKHIPKIISPAAWYEFALYGTLDFAYLQTKFLQNGHLRYYISTILVVFITLAGLAFFSFNDIASVQYSFQRAFLNSLEVVTIYDLIIGLIILIASIFVLISDGRLSSIAALGVAGAMIAVLFIINSAPDLAMTQLSIEILTVILFVFVLYKLPRFSKFSTNLVKIRDLAISLSAGILMTIFIIHVSSYDVFNPEVREFFADTSYILAKGKNIVNVILVDYRGLDTMGEITVLAIAAIGVYSLLRMKNNEEEGK